MSSSRSANIHIVRKFNNSSSTAASSTPQSPTLLGTRQDLQKKERQRQDLFQFAATENNNDNNNNNNNNNNNSNSNSRESSGAIRPGKIRSGFIAFGESDDAMSSGVNKKNENQQEEYIVGETSRHFTPSPTPKISTNIENAFAKLVNNNNNVAPSSSPSNRVTTTTIDEPTKTAPTNSNPMNFVGVLDRNEVRGYSHRNQRSLTMVTGLRGSALLSSSQQHQQRNNSLQPMTTSSATDILNNNLNTNNNSNTNNRRSTVAGGKFTKQQQPPAFVSGADGNPLQQHSSQQQQQQQQQRDHEVEMLKARVRGVVRREGAKAEERRQREQGQLQRDAREIEDWRGWHRDVRDREEAEAQRRAFLEQQQRRASRRSIAMNLLKGRGLIDTSSVMANHASNRSLQDEDSFIIGGAGSDGGVDGTDLLSDDDYATLFGNDEDDDDDEDENDDESFIQQQNQHYSQNNNNNKASHRQHRPSTTSDLIKKLRMERTKRKRQELLRLRHMNMTSSPSPSQQGGGGRFFADDDENIKNNNTSAALTSPTNFFQDLDAEEEFIMVQARLDYKVAVTNMVVCEHEERQRRSGIADDEAFIWSTAMMCGYFARGCREAVLMEQSRKLLAEAKEQRRIWFYIDYMVEDFENGIKRDFVAGREKIRQHDMYLLFESLDEATQRHLVSMKVDDRERFLDDLAVEKFLKNKVNGLKRQKHSLIV